MENTTIEKLKKKTGAKEVSVSEQPNLIWYEFKNSITRNEKGKPTAINLCGQGLVDEDIRDLLEEKDLLSELKSLNLSENKLREINIPESASRLVHLNVSENPELRSFQLEGTYPDLETLDASECKLEKFELPEGCKKLRILDLHKNELNTFVFHSACPALENLDLANNTLTRVSLSNGFPKLLYVYLPDNELEQLAFHPDSLPALKTLHLRNNQLKALPENFLSLNALETLYLHNNPLQGIPKEVIASDERGNSRDDVWNYLQSLQKDKGIALHQAKMILIGNGEVGKTSIRVRLIDENAPLPKKDERTPGLDVIPYTINDLSPTITSLADSIPFQLSIWDFGGQGRYREVQQLFCSRKSLYLFVTSPDDDPLKQDYVGFEYWLAMVNAYGYDESDDQHSPVIHIVNKTDLIDRENPFDINHKDRRKLFPNIQHFLKISARDKINLDLLKDTINKVLPEISKDIFTNQYSSKWMEVKDELEQMRSEDTHHIAYSDYQKLCAKKKMNESEAGTWINILDRIGSVIYFGDHPELKEWVILSPEWVKDAMYKVLDSDLVKRHKGKLKPGDLKDIWKEKENSDEERQKFIALMLAYQLCFEQKDIYGKPEYIVPALLPRQKPPFPPHLQEADCKVKFAYAPLVPAGTVNKLIVSLQNQGRWPLPFQGEEEVEWKGIHTAIYANLMWKNNVVLHDPEHNTYAHLSEDWEGHAIHMDLFGQPAQPLFDFIKASLDRLNQELKNTKYLSYLEITTLGFHNGNWDPIKKLEGYGISFFGEGTKIRENRDDLKISRSKMIFPVEGMEDSSILPVNTTFQSVNWDETIDSTIYPLEDGKVKMLFMAANPTDTAILQIDREFQTIRDRLSQTTHQDRMQILHPETNLKINNLSRAMNQKPQIVHFAGHGLSKGIFIADDHNKSLLFPEAAIHLLFDQHKEAIQLVILNSCYSATQAQLISSFGIFVLGMNGKMGDLAAISFAAGLYTGLGEGKNLKGAFSDAMMEVITSSPAFSKQPEAWRDGKKLNIWS